MAIWSPSTTPKAGPWSSWIRHHFIAPPRLLLSRDARGLDHARPALGVRLQPGTELGRRAAALGDGAQPFELLFGLRLRKRGADCRVQFVDDRRGRVGGRDDAESLRVLLEARKPALCHRQNGRIVGVAVLGAGRIRLQSLLRHLVGDAYNR